MFPRGPWFAGLLWLAWRLYRLRALCVWLHGLNNFVFLCTYLGNCEKEVVLSSANTPYLLLDAHLSESSWVTFYTSAALSESVLWTRRLCIFSMKLISFVILFLLVFFSIKFLKTAYLPKFTSLCVGVLKGFVCFCFCFCISNIKEFMKTVRTKLMSQSIKTFLSSTIVFLRQEKID